LLFSLTQTVYCSPPTCFVISSLICTSRYKRVIRLFFVSNAEREQFTSNYGPSTLPLKNLDAAFCLIQICKNSMSN